MSVLGVKQRFKKAATTVGVALLMTMLLPFAGFAQTTDSNLVAHYTFDGDFKDSSGNGNDGTSTGDVTFVDDGVMGKSASFNGGFVSVNSSPKLNLGSNFTVAVWVKVDPVADSGNKARPIISKLDDKAQYNNYNFYTRDAFGAGFHGRFTGPGRAEKPVLSEKTIINGPFEDWGLRNWAHIVVSSDGKNLYLYHNGALKSTKPLSAGNSIISSENVMRIGTGTNSLFFMGRMDDMRIYDRALSDAEIKGLFNAPWHKIVLKMKSPYMTVDGVEKEIDPGKGTTPVSLNGRTMVPIRAIIEAMGGNLVWTANEQRLDISLKSKTMKLWVNKTTADLDGRQLKMDVPPKIINGRTMVPLRFVSENLGSPVTWNPNTQQLTILYFK